MAVMSKLAVGLSLAASLCLCCEAQLLQENVSRVESQTKFSLRRRLGDDVDEFADLRTFLGKLEGTNGITASVDKSIRASLHLEADAIDNGMVRCLTEKGTEDEIMKCLNEEAMIKSVVSRSGSNSEMNPDKLVLRDTDNQRGLAYVRTIYQEFMVTGIGMAKGQEVHLVGELAMFNGKGQKSIKVTIQHQTIAGAFAAVQARTSLETSYFPDEGSFSDQLVKMAHDKWMGDVTVEKKNMEIVFTPDGEGKANNSTDLTGEALASEIESAVQNSKFPLKLKNIDSLNHVLGLLKQPDDFDRLFDREEFEKFGISAKAPDYIRWVLRSDRKVRFDSFVINIPLPDASNDQLGNNLFARLTLTPEVSDVSESNEMTSSVVEASPAATAAAKVLLRTRLTFSFDISAVTVVSDVDEIDRKKP